MDKPKRQQGGDCPISEGFMLMGEMEESIPVQEAVLRLQARLLEIYYQPGTEVTTKIKDHRPCRRASRIAA